MSTTSSRETALQYSGVRTAGTKPMASMRPFPSPFHTHAHTHRATPPPAPLLAFGEVGFGGVERGDSFADNQTRAPPHSPLPTVPARPFLT